jgi:hypothetical protein
MKATVLTAFGGFSVGVEEEQLADKTNTKASKQTNSSRIDRLMANVSLEKDAIAFKKMNLSLLTPEG